MERSQRDALARELRRLTKAELVGEVLDLAKAIPEVGHALVDRFAIKPTSVKDLIRQARLAIAEATDFDERDVNRNFDVDWAAYERLKRFLVALTKASQLTAAMELAKTLCRDGSYQVEMSDEGLMWDDVTSCLRIVFDALEGSTISESVQLQWAWEMEQSDRVGVCGGLLKEFWQRSRSSEAWNKFAEELLAQLQSLAGDKSSDTADRRRDLLKKASEALEKAGRHEEARRLTEAPFPSRAAKRRRRR